MASLIAKVSLLSRRAKIVLALAIVILAALAVRSSSNNSPIAPGKSDNRISVETAIDTVELNRESTFPLRDENGNEVSTIKYFIELAEIRNELIVQGRKAGSVQGRTFLVLNLRLTNDFDQGIKVNSRDYVRLSVNGNTDEWLAPDIHNDPVEVQAISTKPTRVAFPINESDRDLVLQIGEILGEKETIELDISYN